MKLESNKSWKIGCAIGFSTSILPWFFFNLRFPISLFGILILSYLAIGVVLYLIKKDKELAVGLACSGAFGIMISYFWLFRTFFEKLSA